MFLLLQLISSQNYNSSSANGIKIDIILLLPVSYDDEEKSKNRKIWKESELEFP